ncbi:hypothetical protein RchiOBHm_Chr7g0239971 [Rosa chinensis]|uniref:Uncharacterized protein n=1 Tax=Rosa chinensis TaxID=74649 RepID=A0A2P6PHW5_ROSCH|nr:hypothetical protein RchiOBHm_Chr7g0239971 [Rosa chinensis]
MVWKTFCLYGGMVGHGTMSVLFTLRANFQTTSNNIIFGNRWRHLLGERDFWEHVGGMRSVEFKVIETGPS